MAAEGSFEQRGKGKKVLVQVSVSILTFEMAEEPI
jgi:hypothetical protein